MPRPRLSNQGPEIIAVILSAIAALLILSLFPLAMLRGFLLFALRWPLAHLRITLAALLLISVVLVFASTRHSRRAHTQSSHFSSNWPIVLFVSLGLVTVGAVAWWVYSSYPNPILTSSGTPTPAPPSSTSPARPVATRTSITVQSAVLAGGVVAAIAGLWFNDRRRQHEAESLAHDRAKAQDERFTELMELLGSTSMAVRASAMHSLARVAELDEARAQAVVDVLCSYIRQPIEPQKGWNLRTLLFPTKDELPTKSQSDNTEPTKEEVESWQQLQGRISTQKIAIRILERVVATTRQGPPGGLVIDLSGALLFEDLTIDGSNLNVTATRTHFRGQSNFKAERLRINLRNCEFTEGLAVDAGSLGSQAHLDALTCTGTLKIYLNTESSRHCLKGLIAYQKSLVEFRAAPKGAKEPGHTKIIDSKFYEDAFIKGPYQASLEIKDTRFFKSLVIQEKPTPTENTKELSFWNVAVDGSFHLPDWNLDLLFLTKLRVHQGPLGEKRGRIPDTLEYRLIIDDPDYREVAAVPPPPDPGS